MYPVKELSLKPLMIIGTEFDQNVKMINFLFDYLLHRNSNKIMLNCLQLARFDEDSLENMYKLPLNVVFKMIVLLILFIILDNLPGCMCIL